MKAAIQKETRPVERRPQEQNQEFISPEVNIVETGEGYVLEAEMPGVNKEGLEVTLEDNEITIVGHRHTYQPSGQPLFREISTADYRRVFDLDPAIDTGRISAKIEQGLLRMTLPKSEKVKPRKIAVD